MELHGNLTVKPSPTVVKNGRSCAKMARRSGAIQKEASWILQRVSAGAARRILLPFYPI